MQPTIRHREIIKILNEHGETTVDLLAETLKVSRETIRRDLSKLHSLGKLRKFHGGARSLESGLIDGEGSFAQRMASNLPAKKSAAAAAAALVKPEDTLFIDTGTTTLALCEELSKAKSLIIITNSPRNAEVLSRNSTHTVYLVGGQYRGDAGENVGLLAIEQISKFRARFVFLTVAAVDAEGAMDYDLQEAEVAKAMIVRADQVVVICDHEKFSRRAVFDVVKMENISTIVTNASPPVKIAESMRQNGVKLVVSED